jgi:hypothetical protein
VQTLFTRSDVYTIMTGWVVKYKILSDTYDGEITASSDGIHLEGSFPLLTGACIDELQTTLKLSCQHHINLKKNTKRNMKPLPEEAIYKEIANARL